MADCKADAPDAAANGSGYLVHGIIAAIVVGAVLGGLAPEIGVRLKVVGELFLNALMLIVVPLVMFSMITGITGLGDVRRLGSLGRQTVVYYALTTSLAVLLGLGLVNVVRPGAHIPRGEELPGVAYRIEGTRVGLDRPLVYPRYDRRYQVALRDQEVHALLVQASGTELEVQEWLTADGEPAQPEATGQGLEVSLPVADKLKGKPRSAGAVLEEVVRGLIPRNIFAAMAETQVLPLIIFSLVLGAVLTTLGERGEPAIKLFEALNDAIMGIVHLIMKVAPLGILGLIAGRLGDAGGFAGFMPELIGLGKYFLTVVAGLTIHGLVVLPLILSVIGRRSPLVFARNMSTALLNAFSTASSSATIPLTLQGVRERNGISNRTASFVVPLGATINMDGTALYEAVAVLFIAQVYNVPLGAAAMVIVFLTATLASIGAAGIPEAGLVTMLIVLTAVNLPVEGVALLLTIDWLLDRVRTTVNVWGDAVGSGVVETLQERAATRG